MNFTLGTMLDKITGYDTVLKQYGYFHTGEGTEPWSLRHTCIKEAWVIDIRNSNWIIYTIEGDLVQRGCTPKELQTCLADKEG